ncbi:hypothetical protein J7F03_36905 [Streptomyces sp. ISL-43]|uniref:hypothetical protein n=1 Tax=Streptomyces sp. ISL-43 TaxID=2819183 RepID=UPI001BE7C1AC|nr:hypothetical protein [Streptomyces sp. ISL-43]MBT2452537.1 hypothetical protein [Streptomyces sp. ISL-43]
MAALMALGLLTSAAVLFHVGTTDAFNALTFGGRVVGVAFIAAALVEVIAALSAFDYWGKQAVRYSGAAVLIGVGTVTVTDLMFLITQFEGRDFTPFLWLWIGLLLWVGWAFGVLARQRVWRGIPHPKSIALSVLVSGVVGAASLTYSQIYVPYATPVTVPFDASFGAPTMSADGASLHLPAHVELQNSSTVRIYAVGTLWTVTGRPVTFDPRGKGMKEWKRDFWENSGTLRHVRDGPSRMLGAGEFMTAGSPIEPGEAISVDSVVDVPLRSGLGRVHIWAMLSYIRADRGTLPVKEYRHTIKLTWNPESQQQEHVGDVPEWVADSGDEAYWHSSKIKHSSKMLDLTHAMDYLTAWWTIPKWHEGSYFAKDDTDPSLSVSITRDPDGEEQISDEEMDSYGLKKEVSYTERTVDELLKAASK